MNGKTIRVEVTAEDIAKGIPGRSYCPVALALDRDSRVPWRWRVTSPGRDGRCHAWFAPEGEMPASKLRLPLSVARFVRRFDAGKPVEPFSFRILA